MKTHKTLLILLVAAVTLFSSLAWNLPEARADGGPVRINFARGATSAVVSGNLQANSSAQYILWASAGQLLDVTLSAPQGVSLKATTKSGQALSPIQGTGGGAAFRGYLPYNGDYILTVTSSSSASSYSLNVSIPVRVSFERGATSDRLEYHLNAYQGLDFILRANKGQVLEVNAVAEGAAVPLQLIIYGVDGTVLKSGMGEGSSYRGELPINQDYIVTVRTGGTATDFTLDVIIPQRISFRSGADSGSVYTRLPQGHTQYYILRAMEDQTMRVEISPDEDLQLIIYGVDGNVLKSGMGEDASFLGVLPLTQDYILAVRTARTAAYTLTVTIK